MTYRDRMAENWLNRPFPMNLSDYPGRAALDRDNYRNRKPANA